MTESDENEMYDRRHTEDGKGPQHSLSDLEKDDLFLKVFGVSPATLKAQGRDPTKYAKEHIKEALDDPEIRAQLLPPEDVAHLDMYKWGWRGWLSLYMGIASLIGFVLMKSHSDVSSVFLAMAIASVTVAIYMIGKMGYYNVRYLHLKKKRERHIATMNGLNRR